MPAQFFPQPLHRRPDLTPSDMSPHGTCLMSGRLVLSNTIRLQPEYTFAREPSLFIRTVHAKRKHYPVRHGSLYWLSWHRQRHNPFFYCPPAGRCRSEAEKTAIMSHRTLAPYTQAESPRLPVCHAFSGMDRIPLSFYGKKQSPDRLSEIRVTE